MKISDEFWGIVFTANIDRKVIFDALKTKNFEVKPGPVRTLVGLGYCIHDPQLQNRPDLPIGYFKEGSPFARESFFRESYLHILPHQRQDARRLEEFARKL